MDPSGEWSGDCFSAARMQLSVGAAAAGAVGAGWDSSGKQVGDVQLKPVLIYFSLICCSCLGFSLAAVGRTICARGFYRAQSWRALSWCCGQKSPAFLCCCQGAEVPLYSPHPAGTCARWKTASCWVPLPDVGALVWLCMWL